MSDTVTLEIPADAAMKLYELLDRVTRERVQPKGWAEVDRDRPLTVEAIDLLPAKEALDRALSERRRRILRAEPTGPQPPEAA